MLYKKCQQVSPATYTMTACFGRFDFLKCS